MDSFLRVLKLGDCSNRRARWPWRIYSRRPLVAGSRLFRNDIAPRELSFTEATGNLGAGACETR